MYCNVLHVTCFLVSGVDGSKRLTQYYSSIGLESKSLDSKACDGIVTMDFQTMAVAPYAHGSCPAFQF